MIAVVTGKLKPRAAHGLRVPNHHRCAPAWPHSIAKPRANDEGSGPRLTVIPISLYRATLTPIPMRPLLSVSLLGLVALSGAPPRRAAKPEAMFRGGPSHNGVYQGGGPTLLGLAWRVPTDGDVISSPTIADRVVYVGSGDGHLYALDLAAGARRWRYDAGSAVASSPAVGGGLVFATARDGSIFAVDAGTGALRWRLTTGPALPLPWGHESGDHFLSSPAYVDGTIVVGAGDGGVYAIDAMTGHQKWRAATRGRVRSSPAIAGGRVYVGSFDGRVYCLDLATGARRWTYETEGTTLHSGDYGFDRRSIQSSPAVDDGVVYVGARDGFLYAIGADDGKLRWRYDHKISWIITSPAVSEHVVFAGSSDAHFAQALDSSGKELWRTPTGVPVWSSPAVAGALVYFGDGAGRVHAVDRMSGEEKWMFRTGSTVFSSPAVSGNFVVVGSTDGGVYALRAGDGPAIQRAVFFDSTYLKSGTVRQPEITARALVNRGYKQLDATALAGFLAARIADHQPSVVVFAIDDAPDTVLTRPLNHSLLRRYLDAGGKVVWTGRPPLIFPMDRATGKYPPMSQMNFAAPNDLLGVDHQASLFDARGVHATSDGERLGLPDRWRDSWSVSPAGVTTVLGLDEWGLAAAWIKRYGGPKGTGFVRVPGDDPTVIYEAAESLQ
jgi:outer membrane protein assembly factor BamB